MNGATLGSILNPISRRRTGWITGSVSRPTVRTDHLKGFNSRYLKSDRRRISRIAAEVTAQIPAVMKASIDWINDMGFRRGRAGPCPLLHLFSRAKNRRTDPHDAGAFF